MKTRVVFAALTLAVATAAAAAAAPPLPPPPAFPKGDTTDVIQGVKVADPYRGLEDAADPRVKAWSDAESARTRAYLDALPGREAGSAAPFIRISQACCLAGSW